MFEYIRDWWRGNLILGARSSQWPKTRREYLAKNPNCEVCDTKGTLLNGLECHHCETFSRVPEKENDLTNLITLCRKDHLLFGHLNSWSSQNDDVKIDAQVWYYKLRNRP